MARTVRDTRLESRAARERLLTRHEPYWRTIDQGAHVGYRKGSRGGSWIARTRLDGTRYVKEVLGKADDTQDADGVAVLSFRQAQEKARAWFAEHARKATADPDAHVGPFTVADAMREYLEWYGTHRRAKREVEYRVNAYILPDFGGIEARALTTGKLRRWHEALAVMPRRSRTKRGAVQAYRETPTDPETVRQRRHSANKTLIVLRAALNRAWREGCVADDSAWRRVTPFRDVDQPRVRWLTAAEARRLVNVANTEFRPMIQAALLTGLRYGELAALRCADFDSQSGTIHVVASKSGKPRRVPLSAEGDRFFKQAVAGRAPGVLMFPRAGGNPWGKSHQRRPMAEACAAARITPAVGFHILRHAYGSILAMQGVPLGVIAAALGHADSRITERHYAALAPSYIADVIRASMPMLGIVAPDNVTPLRARP